MKKIISIIGARPQFVKAAVISRVINRFPGLQEIIVHTGQHYDENMSSVFFREMEIPQPHYNLDVNNLSHGAMTGQMMERIEPVLIREKPDWVLVYGDTNSTLAGALTARKLNIPVAHVEAGLRSFNMEMPEEINRILTDRISDFLFCPTDQAMENLKKEGFNGFACRMFQVGDVMYDAALFYGRDSSRRSAIINQLGLTPGNYVLGTVHRQENTDHADNLRSIIEALNKIHRHIPLVLPLHPRTRHIVEKLHIGLDCRVIEPVGYFDMLELLKNSRMILTDSGGMQKEAYYFQKYCITLRKETEWLELVKGGYNFLAGADRSKILALFEEALLKPTIPTDQNLYGQGNAAEKIVNILNDTPKILP